MWIKFAPLVVVAALLSACANKFATDSYSPPTSAISASAKALIIPPKDGLYEGKPYVNSGAMLAAQVEIAVTARLAYVAISEGNDLPTALAQAQSNAIDYVIEPTILHWEDRATEWSGKPDRITIKLVVWDAKTGEIVSTSLERASSRWATFGGDHPQDLLPQLLETWSNRVF